MPVTLLKKSKAAKAAMPSVLRQSLAEEAPPLASGLDLSNRATRTPLGWITEALDAGFEPLLVEIKNGKLTTRTIRRDEFAARFTGRVANWVRSEAKSVSVLRGALGRPGQTVFNRFYRDVGIALLFSHVGAVPENDRRGR